MMNYKRIFCTVAFVLFSGIALLTGGYAQPVGATGGGSADTAAVGSSDAAFADTETVCATADGSANKAPVGSSDAVSANWAPVSETETSSTLEIPLCRATLTGTNGCDHEVHTYSGFVLCYRESYEQSEWVAYTLTRKKLNAVTGRTNDFKSDTKITTESASPKDYTRSGFDRGHLAPAADMEWSTTSVHESFLMSNMSPQVPQFNRGLWKTLEEKVRDWADRYGTLYIVTGPVLEKDAASYDAIGANKVSVPEYFYKVILAPVGETAGGLQTQRTLGATDDASANTASLGATADASANSGGIQYTAVAFILPNRKCEGTILDYAVTVDEAEQRTGLDFYSALPDETEDLIESTFSAAYWN